MSTDKKQFLIILAGQTAVGKTALSLEMADRWKTEILSADSRQIFKEMSIGTAKPSAEELHRVKHHFVNHLSISEDYSAGEYEREALTVLQHIFSTRNCAILSGGTGLYIKAVRSGLDHFPKVSQGILDELEEELKAKGLNNLASELKEKDPLYAQKADLENPRRVIRALSVIRSSGQMFSSFHTKPKKRPFQAIPILLDRPKEEIHKRIEARCRQMWAAGFEEEARDLLRFSEYRSLQTVGYKEAFEYLRGKISREEAITKMITKTRQYAKRQRTWFNKYGPWKKFHPKEKKQILKHIELKINE